MYYPQEIEVKKYWCTWLAEFRVGDKKEADIADRAKIAICITNTFHRKGKAKFKTYKVKGVEDKFTIERLA